MEYVESRMADLIDESAARGDRMTLRDVCRMAGLSFPNDEAEAFRLLEELEAECARRGIELDFSGWENLCVGPKCNQSFAVRKKPLYYARRLLGRL